LAVQELTNHVRSETTVLTRTQTEVKAKDEQIIRWETTIMKKLDDLNFDLKDIQKHLAQKNKEVEGKQQEKGH
jgi:septin family protein